MLKTILILLLVAVAGILAYAASKPDEFRVERSLRIQAPPEKIYPLIEDLHRWDAWSPYEKKDPAMKRTYGGAPSGVGATYAWEGNKEIGKGRMEIIEATAPTRLLIKLDFISPFEGHNTAEFTLAPDGDATRVSWTMAGPAPFVSKLMQVFFNMDRMIGNDFEAGLANLKILAEK